MFGSNWCRRRKQRTTMVNTINSIESEQQYWMHRHLWIEWGGCTFVWTDKYSKSTLDTTIIVNRNMAFQLNVWTYSSKYIYNMLKTTARGNKRVEQYAVNNNNVWDISYTKAIFRHPTLKYLSARKMIQLHFRYKSNYRLR